MIPLRQWLRTLAALLLATAPAAAQEGTQRIRYSLGGGYEWSVIDRRISFPTVIDWCECLDPKGLKGGLSGNALFTTAFYRARPSIDLGLRMELSQLSTRFEQSLPDGTRLQNIFPLESVSPDSLPTQPDMRARYTLTMNLIRFDLMARGGLLLKGLEVESGLTVGYRSFAMFDARIIAPSNTRFVNPDGWPSDRNSEEIITDQDSWAGANTMILGAVVGLSYTFPIGKEFSAMPGIVLRKELIAANMWTPWPTISMRAGISLDYTPAGASSDDASIAPRESFDLSTDHPPTFKEAY